MQCQKRKVLKKKSYKVGKRKNYCVMEPTTNLKKVCACKILKISVKK